MGSQWLSERVFHAQTTITRLGRHPSTFTWVRVHSMIQDSDLFGYLGQSYKYSLWWASHNKAIWKTARMEDSFRATVCRDLYSNLSHSFTSYSAITSSSRTLFPPLIFPLNIPGACGHDYTFPNISHTMLLTHRHGFTALFAADFSHNVCTNKKNILQDSSFPQCTQAISVQSLSAVPAPYKLVL